MDKILKEKLVNGISELKNVYDSFSIKLSENKGLFIQLEHKEEFKTNDKEYFVELNDVYDDEWEPCSYNLRVAFGNVDFLISQIEQYLKNHDLI